MCPELSLSNCRFCQYTLDLDWQLHWITDSRKSKPAAFDACYLIVDVKFDRPETPTESMRLVIRQFRKPYGLFILIRLFHKFQNVVC